MPDIIRKIKLPSSNTAYDVYDERIDSTISAADDGKALVINSDGKIVAGQAGSTERYSIDIPCDGVSTEFTITHNLGDLDVIALIYDGITGEPRNDVVVDISRLNSNAIKLIFDEAPATTENYHCVCFLPGGTTGAPGSSIQTITKTGTQGLVDTYTITLTNGDTSTFQVTNGRDGAGTVQTVNNVEPVEGNITLTTSDIENDSGYVSASNEELTDPMPVNADTLDRHPASYYATKSELDSKNYVPSIEIADEGKLLMVVDGVAAWQTIQDAEVIPY